LLRGLVALSTLQPRRRRAPPLWIGKIWKEIWGWSRGYRGGSPAVICRRPRSIAVDRPEQSRGYRGTPADGGGSPAVVGRFPGRRAPRGRPIGHRRHLATAEIGCAGGRLDARARDRSWLRPSRAGRGFRLAKLSGRSRGSTRVAAAVRFLQKLRHSPFGMLGADRVDELGRGGDGGRRRRRRRRQRQGRARPLL
jgi:hypothetical protein